MQEAKTTAQILREARELISDPERWNQTWLALDSRGKKCWVGSPEAASFCAGGAVQRCTPSFQESGPTWRFLEDVMDESLSSYNDSHTHSEVLAAFDKAIALAEADE